MRTTEPNDCDSCGHDEAEHVDGLTCMHREIEGAEDSDVDVRGCKCAAFVPDGAAAAFAKGQRDGALLVAMERARVRFSSDNPLVCLQRALAELDSRSEVIEELQQCIKNQQEKLAKWSENAQR